MIKRIQYIGWRSIKKNKSFKKWIFDVYNSKTINIIFLTILGFEIFITWR